MADPWTLFENGLAANNSSFEKIRGEMDDKQRLWKN
jgi:hypothetical protein